MQYELIQLHCIRLPNNIFIMDTVSALPEIYCQSSNIFVLLRVLRSEISTTRADSFTANDRSNCSLPDKEGVNALTRREVRMEYCTVECKGGVRNYREES